MRVTFGPNDFWPVSSFECNREYSCRLAHVNTRLSLFCRGYCSTPGPPALSCSTWVSVRRLLPLDRSGPWPRTYPAVGAAHRQRWYPYPGPSVSRSCPAFPPAPSCRYPVVPGSGCACPANLPRKLPLAGPHRSHLLAGRDTGVTLWPASGVP